MENKQPQFPCRNCIYFKSCGESTRTMPCNGRVTKTEKEKRRKRCKIWKHGQVIY